MHEQKRVPGTGAERLVFKELQVSALQTDFCSCSKRSLRRSGSKSCALVSKTLSWGTLGMTIRPPAAHGLRSEIKGDPSGVRTSGFFEVRGQIDFLGASTKGPR